MRTHILYIDIRVHEYKKQMCLHIYSVCMLRMWPCVCGCGVCVCLHVHTVNAYARMRVCSQGRLCAGKGGAGEPGSGSVGPDHQHAAVNRSAERQRGGQDEADADQQEHGRGIVPLRNSQNSIQLPPWIPYRFQ